MVWVVGRDGGGCQFIIYNCISCYERKIRRRICYQRRVDSYAIWAVTTLHTKNYFVTDRKE